jgi:hypothetical protein
MSRELEVNASLSADGVAAISAATTVNLTLRFHIPAIDLGEAAFPFLDGRLERLDWATLEAIDPDFIRPQHHAYSAPVVWTHQRSVAAPPGRHRRGRLPPRVAPPRMRRAYANAEAFLSRFDFIKLIEEQERKVLLAHAAIMTRVGVLPDPRMSIVYASCSPSHAPAVEVRAKYAGLYDRTGLLMPSMKELQCDDVAFCRDLVEQWESLGVGPGSPLLRPLRALVVCAHLYPELRPVVIMRAIESYVIPKRTSSIIETVVSRTRRILGDAWHESHAEALRLGYKLRSGAIHGRRFALLQANERDAVDEIMAVAVALVIAVTRRIGTMKRQPLESEQQLIGRVVSAGGD